MSTLHNHLAPVIILKFHLTLIFFNNQLSNATASYTRYNFNDVDWNTVNTVLAVVDWSCVWMILIMYFMLLSMTVLITTFHILLHLVLAVTLNVFILGLSDVSKVKNVMLGNSAKNL